MTYSSSSTTVSPLSEADLIVDTIAHLSMNYYEQGPELPLNGLAQASPSYVEQEKPPEQPGKWRQTSCGLGRGEGSILWTCVAAGERQADMACFLLEAPLRTSIATTNGPDGPTLGRYSSASLLVKGII